MRHNNGHVGIDMVRVERFSGGVPIERAQNRVVAVGRHGPVQQIKAHLDLFFKLPGLQLANGGDDLHGPGGTHGFAAEDKVALARATTGEAKSERGHKDRAACETCVHRDHPKSS